MKENLWEIDNIQKLKDYDDRHNYSDIILNRIWNILSHPDENFVSKLDDVINYIFDLVAECDLSKSENQKKFLSKL